MCCIRTVRAWIEKHRLIEPGSTVLAAVSGGPDSMAMLEILAELAPSLEFALAAAYFDHGIRPESAREQRLVERRCAALGIPLYTGCGKVPARAKKTRTGLEEAARGARHEFLAALAPRAGAAAVALAHTRDDQVETILHHIIRGTGLRGLAGMPVRRGIIIRPVLACSGEQLRSLCRRRGVRYAIDRSNRDTAFMRNRIRRVLLPLLRRRFNPAVDAALLRLADNAAATTGACEQQVRELFPARGCPDDVQLAADTAAALAEPQLQLLVDLLLRERLGIFQDIDKVHFDAVKSLIRSGRSGKTLHLPQGLRVTREHGLLRFFREAKVAPGPPPDALLPGCGRFSLPGWGLEVRVTAVPAPGGAGAAGTETALLAGVSFPLRVRTRRSGDRLVPFGMTGSRKLSDIMIDRKIPLRERNRVPVFEDRLGIVWVPGVVAAERTRIFESARAAPAVRLEILPGRLGPTGPAGRTGMDDRE